MNIPFLKWAPFFCAVGVIALTGLSASASSDLLTATGSTAPLFASKDKVCVVSQNTGLAMWYNCRNHGFVETNAVAGRDSGFATPEELMFGPGHQISVDVFGSPGMFAADLGESPMNRFLARATSGFGVQTGLLFAKDGSIYLATETPDCDVSMIDLAGLLVDATLSQGTSIPSSVRGLMLKGKPVPEPSSFVLFAFAATALAGSRRFRRA